MVRVMIPYLWTYNILENVHFYFCMFTNTTTLQ